MRSYIRFILRRRGLVLGGMLLLSLAAAAMLPRAVIASTLTGMFFGEHQGFLRYVERVQAFASDEVTAIALEGQPGEGGLLEPQNLARLRRAVEGLSEAPGVRAVRSILDAGVLVGSEDGELLVRRFAEEAEENPTRAAALLEELRLEPEARGLVVSSDGQHQVILLEYEPDLSRAAEGNPARVQGLRDTLLEAGFAPEAIHLGGPQVVIATVISESVFNLVGLLPIVGLLLFLVGWLMFRRLWPVLIALSVAAIATLWTSGIAVLIEPQINIFLSVVPAIVLVVSFSDVVHLCSAYLIELGAGKDKAQAIEDSASEVGAACLFTSATTFVGFTALAFVPSPAMQQAAAALGIGVGATLLLALTLTPIVLHALPAPSAPTRGAMGGPVGKLLAGAQHVSTTWPIATLLAFALLSAISLAGIARLTVDTSFSRRFSARSAVSQDLRFLRGHFAGADVMPVFIDLADGAESDLLEPERLARIAALEARLEARDDVVRVFSFVDVVDQLHHALRPDAPAGERLPADRNALAQYLLLYEIADAEDLGPIIDDARRSTVLTLNLRDDSLRDTHALGELIRSLAEQTLGPELRAEVGGVFYFLGGWLDHIVLGQRQGLGFSILVIALMMMIGLRSWRVGLWSMVPNLLPLIFLGGLLGLGWDRVDSDSLVVAMIAVGLGVDDTIHFLMRLRIEQGRRGGARDPEALLDALQSSFHFAGRAIVITSVILVAGFLPFAASAYYSLWIFGTLLPMTIVAALAADLFLLPALVRLGWVHY